MSHTKVTASANSLQEALETAVSELVDGKVAVAIDGPDGVELRDVNVRLNAVVSVRDNASDDGAAADEEAAPPAAVDAVEDVEDLEDVEDGTDGDEPVARDSDEQQKGDDSADGVEAEDHGDQLDREVDVAADFVEGILDAMALAGELELRLNDVEQSAEVEVVNMDNGVLIGRRGSTLESIQELMRCALQSQFDRRVRITVDVEGYRARRLEKLLDKADDAIDDVLDGGESVRLEPMDVFERKAVHELVGAVEGVISRSQGREPSRRVVIEPAEG